MIMTYGYLRAALLLAIQRMQSMGRDTSGLADELGDTPDSYDQLIRFGERLMDLPMRPDAPGPEPMDWEQIAAACSMPSDTPPTDIAETRSRIESAFLGSVCGCQLGKPIEVNPSMEELRKAFESVGEWPINDYVPEAALVALGRREKSAPQTMREALRYAAPDDDINYSVIGMLVLEQYGAGFTQDQLADLWFQHLPLGWTYGPERNVLGTMSIGRENTHHPLTAVLAIGDIHCGAQIRADAYGYACPGRPSLAAELACRDARLTHEGTGVYATMFTAAAIAIALGPSRPDDDRLQLFRDASQVVPPRSRFAGVIRESIDMVASASDWLEAYDAIHQKYESFDHCWIHQETASLMNSFRFAESVGDGICKQVMQGNDTDSYGATAGSLLGAYFGPGHLEDRWLKPFNDTLRTTVADFHEHSLAAVARRMARLPESIAPHAGSSA